ncbi:hypothetical protein HYALB_00004461 [Hymenoscyphus albidus]|uniref:C2H2-type domain-containing protein n=1 Tax=Hymenoscyphus albidus TaxID=595503 RepID=A0A9N9LLG6_9HELO|nr:hypothetical protein HYALB_00004461 [Hymenoscyphus albidus]
MDITLAYDNRAASSGDFTARAVLAPQYMLNQQYHGSAAIIATQQHVPTNPFSFGGYAGVSGVPSFTAGYIQQRPLPPLAHTPHHNEVRAIPYERNNRQGFVEAQLSQSPPIKPEPCRNLTPNTTSASSTALPNSTKTIKPAVSINGAPKVDFCTEVDTLMKAIQAQPQPSNSPSPSPVVGASFAPHTHSDSYNSGYSSGETSTSLLTAGNFQDDTVAKKGNKKRYTCTVGNCNQRFSQKTHLDIHVRSHTGEKPYNCNIPGCGQSFSQLGNLKTHEYRHTGERPYACDICGKRFSQRGNVRQHKTVHGKAKPYPCKLDDGTGKECGKLFTQLGNLKSHQNKFHVAALRDLTIKFAAFKNGENVSAAENELLEYFRELYKNSNKGIKGRGKQRKVGPDSDAISSGLNSLALDHSYSLSGPGRGNMIVNSIHNVLPEVHLQGRVNHGRYEICEVDDSSQSGHSVSGSGSGYDDVHSDGYGNHSPQSDLAFGDRIY